MTMKKKKEPEKHNDFEDAFIREIDEELKNEHLKKLWDKYGLFIILFVVIAISAAVSFETFKSWQEKRNQEFSDAYAYALNLQNQGRYAEAMEVLNNLTKAKKAFIPTWPKFRRPMFCWSGAKLLKRWPFWKRLRPTKTLTRK